MIYTVVNPVIFFTLAGGVFWKTSKVNLGFVFWKIGKVNLVFWKIDEVKLMEINYPYWRVSLLVFLVAVFIFCKIRNFSDIIFLPLILIGGAIYLSSEDIKFVVTFVAIFILWFAFLSYYDLEICRCFIYGWIVSKLSAFSKGACLLLLRYVFSYFTVLYLYCCYEPIVLGDDIYLNSEDVERQFSDKYTHQDVVSVTFIILLASLLFMSIFGLLQKINQYRKIKSIFSSQLDFCNYFRENYKKNKIIFKNRRKMTNFSGIWVFLNRKRDRSFSITKTPSRHVYCAHKKETTLLRYLSTKKLPRRKIFRLFKLMICILANILRKNDYDNISEKYKEKVKNKFSSQGKKDYRKIDEIFENYDEIDEIFKNHDEVDKFFKTVFRDLLKKNEMHKKEVKNFLTGIAN